MTQVDVIATGDTYKDEVQRQWNEDACGSHYVTGPEPGTLEWYLEAERYRYDTYAPWMAELMEFTRHRGHKLLEVGAGMGTDLAQFAKNGAVCTDLDLSAGHLEHARRNFELRGLEVRLVHGDGEELPFASEEFDVVYSNGVIHHTPNTARVIAEIHRVLKPGGKAIIMVYAENSWNYWRQIVYERGVKRGDFATQSAGEIMSRSVEISSSGQKPLVKVYTAARLREMFSAFREVRIYKRQLLREELPKSLHFLPIGLWMRLMGWNLVLKATKPHR
jgi:ubiquinone/menaquinone biosynthesis C-methylase UbiE